MEKFQLPERLMNDLKCELCYEYLSYPPITLHADTGSVCGRCPSLEAERNITSLRESNYEKLARNLLLFPCRYQAQGCGEILSMEQTPPHEAVCNFKPFFCPILPLGDCPWQGMVNECQIHFATDHQDLLLDDSVFELNLIQNYQTNMLMAKFDGVFLIHNEFYEQEGFFYCSIYQIMPVDGVQYNYILEFFSGDGENKFKSDEKAINMYTDTFSKDDGFKFNVVVLRETLNNPTMVTCSIEIVERIENIDLNTLTDVENNVEIFPEVDKELQKIIKIEDDKMLLDLECPVCQDFMIPPIYQCQTGHSVCGFCKPQLRECPSCRGQLGETRNFTLEKITEHIMYQCKNRYEGCDFRTTSKNIKKHEQECKFSPIKCPFNEFKDCQWKGLHKNIISHFKIDHDVFISTDPLYIQSSYLNDGVGEQQRITTVFNEVFRVRLGYNNEKRKVYGTVQFVGPSEEAKKFMYEVQVSDLNKKGIMLLSKKYCGSINDKKNEMSHCTVWPLEMVVPFMSEDKHIHMKYKISKAKC